jgi:hypothetical protein
VKRQAPAWRRKNIGGGTFWREYLMRSTIIRRLLAGISAAAAAAATTVVLLAPGAAGAGNSLASNSLEITVGNSQGNSL